MGDVVVFTDNIRDLSNPQGYQFEFVCERCGNGYRSPFQADKLETGRNLLRGAGRMFGGKLEQIGYSLDGLDRNTNSAAKDKAMEAAVAHVKDHFKQCRGCGNWVCVDVCWNHDVGQCLSCSPSVQDELSRAQAAAQVDQIREKTREVDWTNDLDLATRAIAKCPQCGADPGGGKFCQDCGASVAPKKFCGNCGAEAKAAAKFCAECGSPS